MDSKKMKILEYGAIKEIAAKFKITTETVRNALANKHNSILSERIRKYARKNYTCIEY